MLLNSIHAVLRMFADSVPNFCQCNNYIQGKSVTCCKTAMGRRQRSWRSCKRISIRVKSASTDETNIACAWQVNVSSGSKRYKFSVFEFNIQIHMETGSCFCVRNSVFSKTFLKMNILWVLYATTKWLYSGGLEAKEAFVYRSNYFKPHGESPQLFP